MAFFKNNGKIFLPFPLVCKQRILFFFFGKCFLEGVRGTLFLLKKVPPHSLKSSLQTKKRIWFTNPLFSLCFGN